MHKADRRQPEGARSPLHHQRLHSPNIHHLLLGAKAFEMEDNVRLSPRDSPTHPTPAFVIVRAALFVSGLVCAGAFTWKMPR